jgi:hypothetical protein
MSQTEHAEHSHFDEPANLNNCECGRSPNGRCIGWHRLDEATYQVRLAQHNLELTTLVPPIEYVEPAPQTYTWTNPDTPAESAPE